MKTKLFILLSAALLVYGSTNLYGAVSVYESFGNATDGLTIAGYSGTSAELGLTGTWALSGTGAQSIKARTAWEYVGVAEGYEADTVSGSQHWWEHNNNWTINTATRSLSGTIDLSVDGTTYMSFFSMSGKADYLAQAGLSNSTNELMFGQAYSGASNKGLTAYYGATGANVQTNCNGTTLTYGSVGGKYKTGFYVAEFVKSNSGTTNDLVVTLKWYDFGVMAAKTNDITVADVTRTISLTGVTGSFNTLKLKLSGGSTNWPSMDEIRVGQNLMDVTGVNVVPINPDNGEQLVQIDTNLEWSVASGWPVNVYLSNPYTDPNANPVLSQVSAGNSTGVYDLPSNLDNNKWYYWRVDALEPNVPNPIVHTGKVWSFKTIGLDPILYAVTPSLFTVPVDGTGSVVFSVTGLNIDSYQWYKIGSPDVQLTEGVKYAGTTTNLLTVSNAGLSDEGYYYCVVSNLQSPNTASNRDTGAGRLMTKRLVIHYPLDTVVSGKTPDVVSGYNMTLVSDNGGIDYPTLASGKIGSGAILFNNISSADPNTWGQYATAGDVDVEAMGNGFTLEFWVNYAGTNGTTQGVIGRRNSWASGQMMWSIEYNPATGLYAATNGNSTTSTPLTANTWAHVAVTHDGASTMKVYVNGVYKTSGTNLAYWGGVNSPLMLAASDLNATTGLASNFFNGMLDDVKFYNYVRSTEEIAQDYLAVEGGWICNSELTALPYDFNDNCQVDLEDLALLAATWLDNNRIYPNP